MTVPRIQSPAGRLQPAADAHGPSRAKLMPLDTAPTLANSAGISPSRNISGHTAMKHFFRVLSGDELHHVFNDIFRRISARRFIRQTSMRVIEEVGSKSDGVPLASIGN
jgi:hypothetical protein